MSAIRLFQLQERLRALQRANTDAFATTIYMHANQTRACVDKDRAR